MKRFFHVLSLSLFLVGAFSAGAWAYGYVVKNGNSLSKIAGKLIPGPVWGKNGSFKKVLALNPEIKDPNFIVPGQNIIIDGELTTAQVNDAGLERAPASDAAVENTSSDQSFETKNEATKPGYGIFSLTPEFSSTKLVGKDLSSGAKATLVSKSSYGVNASYSQVWNSKLQTDFFFGFTKLSIVEPSSGGTLSNADQTLYSFGAIVNYKLSPSFAISPGFGITQRAYMKAISATSIGLEATSVPTLFVESAYDFFYSNPFTMGASALVGIDMPSSSGAFDTKYNPSYGARAYVKHFVSDSFQTEVGLKARYQVENTSIVDQTQTDYGIYLKLQYSFGQGKK